MQQKVFIVKEYYKSGNSVVRGQKKFCTDLSLREGPAVNTVWRLVEQFEETGSLFDQQVSRWTPVHTHT
jgi:hypothetical protein